MEKWEYKIIDFDIISLQPFAHMNAWTQVSYVMEKKRSGREKVKAEKKDILRTELDNVFSNLGKEGWELVGVLPFIGKGGFSEAVTKGAHFIFKRRILKTQQG